MEFALRLKVSNLWNFRKKNRDKFEHYLELPMEIQMRIVNRMPADDRCRFSGCSKLSREEVDISKNYVRKFEFNAALYGISVLVEFGKATDTRLGFRIDYFRDFGGKYMKCENLRGRELYCIDLEDSEPLSDYALQHSKGVLQMYQSKIKELKIVIGDAYRFSKPVDFGITNLKNLEELNLKNVPAFQQFLSKIRKNLKVLEIVASLDKSLVLGSQQIHRVQRNLFLPTVSFTKQELLQLSARLIYSHIGALSVEDVMDLIKLWQNGNFGEDFVAYSWCIGESNFNVAGLFALFGEELNPEENKSVHIKHDKRVGIDCRLSYHSNHRAPNQQTLIFVNLDRLCGWPW